MTATRRRLLWRLVPPAGLVVAVFVSLLNVGGGLPASLTALPPLIEFIALAATVFASVHHADVIAHRTGEPYGTLVLTVAVTVIEVALILSIMLAGDGSPSLARETVFAVIMVVCNGVVGICLIVGGFRYGEQGFRLPGAGAYLVVLMPLATLTLILPTYTTSAPGPNTATNSSAHTSELTERLDTSSSLASRFSARFGTTLWAAARPIGRAMATASSVPSVAMCSVSTSASGTSLG